MVNKKGFTLIELLIVIAIIGILAAAATTAYIGTQRSAARSEAYTNLQNLRLLEEQFFAENAAFTTDMGTVNNNTVAVRDANVLAIQTNALPNRLPGFRPGNDSSFVYWIVQNFNLPAVPATPFNPANVVAVVAPNQCFVAFARGITGTRVDGDLFVIDCNNIRNF